MNELCNCIVESKPLNRTFVTVWPNSSPHKLLDFLHRDNLSKLGLDVKQIRIMRVSMSIPTSLLHHVRVEAVLHRVGGSGANAPARGIPTDDECVCLHRNKLTGQRRPKEGAAELLLDDHLALLRSANRVPRRIIPELVANVETG